MKKSIAIIIVTLAMEISASSTSPQFISLPDSMSSYASGFKNATINYSAGGEAICISGKIDITATGFNAIVDLQEPSDQIAVTEFLVRGVQVGSTTNKDIVTGHRNITGTWNIHSQLCFPKAATALPSTVQFLTHGLLADRRYWDIAPGYSFVDSAAKHGYATFLFDRLGTGLSDHPDPIQVVQAGLQVAVAHEIIQLLRAGGIANHTFDHIVGVGHSFGSFQTLGITVKYPKDFDAVVLTGFSTDTTGFAVAFSGAQFSIASLNQPLRFGNLSSGYLTSNNVVGAQFAAFQSPGFEPLLLDLCEKTKGTISIGEYLTTASTLAVATQFTGPIDVVNGSNDLPNCGGNCLHPENLAAAVKGHLYPAASNSSESHIASEAGHFWNFHYSAPTGFEQIQNFVERNGF